MDDFFHVFSRFVIVIPVAAVIIGLIMKFQQNPVVSPQAITVTPTVAVSPSPVPTAVPVQIDLTGPWVCQSSSPGATVSAFIKNKQITAKIQNNKQINNIVVNGDCLYYYLQGAYSGEKICGIGQYLNLFNVLPLNLLDDNMLKSLVPQGLQFNIDSLKKGLDSCRKEVIPDDSVFAVPKNILFKNK